jgi:hypothetical protein
MNVPYKKQFNEAGDLLNPIESIYLNESPNRKQRRFKAPRFKGNGNQYHLTVTPVGKYHRRAQLIEYIENPYEEKSQLKRKTIYHYDAR